MEKYIDLRSDTVTRPCTGMKAAMMDAPLGDDVYGEDPSVNELEEFSAALLGTEDALFCTSGTQSNLLGLLVHCARGDEYIVGQGAHTYLYEGGGAAVLGSIQPQPLVFENDGTLDLEKVSQLIKPDNVHFARTRLLCLENTHLGKVVPVEYLEMAHRFCRDRSLSMHLDGARVFNAAVRLDIDVKQITQYFDTISCCLSKGLGSPVGSVLCGPEPLIKEARKWRKMLGGGMRQAGVLAAAGTYALKHNIKRLEEDHKNASRLADQLNALPQIDIDLNQVQTNILFAGVDADINLLQQHLKGHRILIDPANPTRMVTHLDITPEDIERIVLAVKTYFD